MLNKVILMGRLTADPELRYTKSEVPVTAFSLAVNRDFKGQNGEAPVDFIDIVCWRHTAEFASNYFHKMCIRDSIIKADYFQVPLICPCLQCFNLRVNRQSAPTLFLGRYSRVCGYSG